MCFSIPLRSTSLKIPTTIRLRGEKGLFAPWEKVDPGSCYLGMAHCTPSNDKSWVRHFTRTNGSYTSRNSMSTLRSNFCSRIRTHLRGQIKSISFESTYRQILYQISANGNSIGNITHVHFAANVFSLPLKTAAHPRGLITVSRWNEPS